MSCWRKGETQAIHLWTDNALDSIRGTWHITTSLTWQKMQGCPCQWHPHKLIQKLSHQPKEKATRNHACTDMNIVHQRIWSITQCQDQRNDEPKRHGVELAKSMPSIAMAKAPPNNAKCMPLPTIGPVWAPVEMSCIASSQCMSCSNGFPGGKNTGKPATYTKKLTYQQLNYC